MLHGAYGHRKMQARPDAPAPAEQRGQSEACALPRAPEGVEGANKGGRKAAVTVQNLTLNHQT